ncbi:MAG: prepilin-type N-terminal cleavage/methylation domain-containing protein [Gemmatimonadota bacterium]|nr:prepilin-type N-terminal cleavage/methylation domain-containing protein [Gemmatimonadota bacterium]
MRSVRPVAFGKRAGVTLLELLVVLVLIAISATLVVPAMRLPQDITKSSGTRDGSDAIITNARRIAIMRGEPVHLKVDADGVWAVVPLRGGDAIQAGRTSEPLRWHPDVNIDAIGVCALNDGVVPRDGVRAWDALACRWVEAKS